MDTQTWIVDELNADKRLDIVLTEQFPNYSRSAIQKWMKQGKIQVNDKPATVHQFLKTHDKITFREKPPIESERKDLLIPSPRIIAETDDWIVIDKPSGLLVHPTLHTTTPTLIDWLMAHDPSIGRVGENPVRPGLVHRLDREVSGLMLVAKTQSAYDALRKQFAQRGIRKHYLALVHGEISKTKMTSNYGSPALRLRHAWLPVQCMREKEKLLGRTIA